MINCVFYALFFTLFLSTSLGSLRFSQVNRVFMSIYKGMLEASVITVDENGNSTMPYYSEELIDEYIVSYLNINLNKYVSNYQINTEYLNKEDLSYCDTNCHALRISLKADITLFYTYQKSQLFVVNTRDEIWMKN